MRFAIVLVAGLSTWGCSQKATKPVPEETQASPPMGAQQADRSSAPAQSSYDSRSPNWQVKSIKLSDNRWRVELRMQRWHTGGDGEAEVLFRDQARELAQQQGYRHYVILSWVQGIESSVPIAQRWARGEIELQEALPPMPAERP